VTWIGYDTPRNLGSRETGGGLSLPVWISFMEQALKGVPVMEQTVPAGVVNVGGEWFYEEYARNAGVANLGLEAATGAAPGGDGPAPEERSRILDLFRN
jgi:penicillin-binding protein 1A